MLRNTRSRAEGASQLGVPVSSQLNETSAFAAATTSALPERLASLSANLGDLRARAARYRELADALWDPRVIAVVQACARQLDGQAALMEMSQAPPVSGGSS